MAEITPWQVRWRTGRSLGRTLYVQVGPEPSTADEFVGIMDTPELADYVCDAVNARLEFERLA